MAFCLIVTMKSFDCAFKLKFSQSIFTFLNINTNQTFKGQGLNFIRSNLFWELP